MSANITKLDKGVPSFFLDNGAILMFEPITDYTTVGVEALKNPVDLGNIKEDSTSWEGEDISIETKRNERGEAVVTVPKEGTFAFAFDVMSTDTESIKKLMKALDITGTVGAWMSNAKIAGIGKEIASQICPVGWANLEKDKVILFPKARVTAGFKYDDDMLVVHVMVSAEKVDTDKLQTVMILSGAKLNYGTPASDAS